MTTKRTYTCNVCNEEINPSKEDGLGIYFTGEFNGRIELRSNLSSCETHICNECLIALCREGREKFVVK